MKNLILFLLSLLPFLGFSQLKVAKAADPQVENVKPYDSLTLFPKDPRCLVGQKLYVPSKAESSQGYGYEGFLNEDGFNYGTTSKHSTTPHELIAERTFEIINVKKTGEDFLDRPEYLLELKDEKGVVFYKYPQYSHSFAGIIMGCIEKMDNTFKTTKYYVVTRTDIDALDFKTGEKFNLVPNSILEYQEIFLDDKYRSLTLLFKDKDGHFYATSQSGFENWYISCSRKEELVKKYGKDMTETAIMGKVKIGMHTDLVLVAFGRMPDRINQSSGSDQWVFEDGYGGNTYVYIRNNKVTG